MAGHSPFTCSQMCIRDSPWAGLIGSALLLLLTWWVPVYRGSMLGIKGLFGTDIPGWLVDIPALYPLGLGAGEGADYFPLLPLSLIHI